MVFHLNKPDAETVCYQKQIELFQLSCANVCAANEQKTAHCAPICCRRTLEHHRLAHTHGTQSGPPDGSVGSIQIVSQHHATDWQEIRMSTARRQKERGGIRQDPCVSKVSCSSFAQNQHVLECPGPDCPSNVLGSDKREGSISEHIDRGASRRKAIPDRATRSLGASTRKGARDAVCIRSIINVVVPTKIRTTKWLECHVTRASGKVQNSAPGTEQDDFHGTPWQPSRSKNPSSD